MEVTFSRDMCTCYQCVLSQIQNLEQTQELRLPDGLPEVGQILGCWGQTVLRGKEWQSDRIRLSAGIMIWVLYLPEGGGQAQRLETWIPFQTQFDLPPDTAEGSIHVRCLTRYAEARSITAGKLLIRAGVGILAECMTENSWPVYTPDRLPEGVELLQQTYPMELVKAVGEKAFHLEEELRLPPSAPVPEEILYYRLCPGVGDKKVLANKLVFRGCGNLHILYRSREGQLHCWDFEVPFSQFVELEDSYSTDARGQIHLCVTGLELELGGEGQFLLKSGLTAQYQILDRKILTITTDAYAPGKTLQLRQEMLMLPAVLDSRRQQFSGEYTLSAAADAVVDVCMLPDFPSQRQQGDHVLMELPVNCQILYYGDNGQLQGTKQRMELQHKLAADSGGKIVAAPDCGWDGQVDSAANTMTVRAEIPVELRTEAAEGMEMVRGLEIESEKRTDVNRPSLILRRAGPDSLWQIAKESGSSMTAIREINGLTGEPVPGQMLLIPVK